MSDSVSIPGAAPVILLVFNRPLHTRKMLEAVRLAKPPLVLVVADGPRPHVPSDTAACAEVRTLIDQAVNWDAKVLKNYAATNLGLRQRVSSGLAWAFEQVEQAVVLEDDCVPHPAFFRFCADLLQHYQNDTRVGVISGDNFQPRTFTCKSSYYFSKFNHCWGWATWRRAWRFFDEAMKAWPELRDAGWLEGVFPEAGHAKYWRNIFDGVYDGRLNSWAYAWTFACWSQSLLTIIPRANLVTNIGFDASSTHTADTANPLANLPAGPMTFPLTHPGRVVIDYPADHHTQSQIFGSHTPPPVTEEANQKPVAQPEGWWEGLKQRWVGKTTIATK